MTIQDDFEHLETLLHELETSDIDLEKSVDLYANAVKKANALKKKLAKIESKLTIIEEKQGQTEI